MFKRKEKWHLVSKKGKNFENLFLGQVARGVGGPDITWPSASKVAMPAFLQAAGNRYFPYLECQRHIKKLNKLLKTKPALLIAEYHAYQKILKKMAVFAKTIPQHSFNKINWPAFLDQWSYYIRLAISYGYNYYFLNQPIAEIILATLIKAGAQENFADFGILSQAGRLSAIQQEKIGLIRLVKLFNKKQLTASMLSRHLQRYGFMGHYYMRGQHWQNSNLLLRIKELAKGDWLKEEKRLKELAAADGLSRSLMKRHRFNKYERQLVSLMKEMTYATNLFDEVHNYYFFRSRPAMLYLAKKIGVSYDQLIEMDFDELLNLLASGKKASALFKKILIAREKESVLVCCRGKVEILSGVEAKKYIAKNLPQNKAKTTGELKGQCACQGQATGRVVIFKSVADINRVKKGNIMVAKATVPSFVPAMEKAAGIITEMGGLLSHAAIVSRELGVPCVVGVENVTKLLKDGDRVAIEANQGIIKKI